MKWYWIKTAGFVKWLMPHYIWSIKAKEKVVYLTFDDGPVPQVTPWVLDVLKQYGCKATFFCIGDNIRKNPGVFKAVIDQGHAIGNHTFNHLNGWTTTDSAYEENIRLCEEEIRQHYTKGTRLFRPPYGKIKKKQAKRLLSEGKKIIMWDIITADFDQSISKEACLFNATDKVEPGSIIIFHDSIKAFPNLEYTLPRAIAILRDKGYRFEKLD